MKISRQAYADMFGPTVGDKVRLADTELWIEVEKDFTTYGEEVKFGGGKVIRDGMGQGQLCAADVVDTLITNALILDHWGIVKADVGLKDGRIAAIGKAGNPDIQPDVSIAIGAATEVIAGEGMILTAGGIDSHIHFICPQQIEEALMSGVTTMIGGGTGPATGTNATTVTPGPWHMAMMLKAADAFPMNIGFTGKGNASLPEPLIEQVKAGAIGLKLHEDWGTTPAAIDNCLSVADQYDVQVAIHTDTLNESGFVETTLGAFKGRTIHTYHTEGAGGGEGAGSDRRVVAATQHRRQCQQAHGDHGGADDTGAGRKQRADHADRNRQAATHGAEQPRHRFQQVFGDARFLQHHPHEDEQRYRQHRLVVHDAEDAVRQRVQITHVERAGDHADAGEQECHAAKGEGDRVPGHQSEADADEQQDGHDLTHGSPPALLQANDRPGGSRP
jgi:hypothetical protein